MKLKHWVPAEPGDEANAVLSFHMLVGRDKNHISVTQAKYNYKW